MRPTILYLGGTLYWVIHTYDSAGELVDADSTPTVAVRKNGASVGDSVTVTKRSATTGIYDCSYNPAGELEGDSFTFEESATISAVVYPNSWAVTVAYPVLTAIGSLPDDTSQAIAYDVANLVSDWSLAIPVIQDGLATSTALATLSGYVDTEVAAIKAKTDQMSFSTGGIVVSTNTNGDNLASVLNTAEILDAIQLLGDGPLGVTITVVDGSAVPVGGITVVVLDSGGSSIGVWGTTSSSGIAVFYLDADDYQFTIASTPGFEAHTPQSLTVDGDGELLTLNVDRQTIAPDLGSTTLKVRYDELLRDVGRHLGFDRDPDNWESNQTQDVEDIIKSGQWHFYWPPSLDQEGSRAHVWSFLCVSHQISLVAGTIAYDLPDDFVRMQSGFTFGSDGNQFRLSVIEDERLRSMQSKSYLTGVPYYVAIRARNDRADEGYELAFYPTPDRAFTISFRYEKLPSEIDENNQYHLGPSVHSKLLVSACLMEADRKLNPESSSPDGGLHVQQFFRQLSSSIAIDRQVIGVPSRVTS